MNILPTLATVGLFALTGCAHLAPPTAEKLAALPVVTYPDSPQAGDYVFKLPAGRPIAVHVRGTGSALAAPVEATLAPTLVQDLYLYKDWASTDGRTWHPAQHVVGVNLSVTLPSHQDPRSGDIHLTVDRKTPR